MFVDRMGTEKKLLTEYFRNKLSEEYRIEFVKSYDEYLRLEEIYNMADKDYKDALYNPLYHGTFKYLRWAKNEAYNQLIMQEEIVKELHNSRNIFNRNAWETVNIVNQDEWWELPFYRSWYHQHTANIINMNRKFVSSNGHYESIYDSEWYIVNDIKDIWTYNIFHPVEEADNHWKYDVEPYKKWWNWIGDNTTKFERITWF